MGQSVDDNRNDFSPKIREVICKRAQYICSNPDCRAMTLAPSDANADKVISTGKASHISAAAPKGPRFDSSLTSEQRSSAENGLFLCSVCADMIDKNGGIDYSTELLKKWKAEHEVWVRNNLNKSINPNISVIDGEHRASGRGNITGLDVHGPAFFKPGTKVIAEGEGNITGTRISYKKDENK